MQELRGILGERHRRLRVSAAGVIVAVVALAVPAGAGPSRTYGPPYSSYGDTANSCTSGATCGPTWAGTAQGSVRATSSYNRSAPSTGEAEQSSAYSGMMTYLVLPRGTSAATVTFTWHITRAVSVAKAGKGVVYTGTSISAGVVCGSSCTAERAFSEVTAQCAEANGCFTQPPPSVAGKNMSVRIRLSNVSGQFITAYSSAYAFSTAMEGCLLFLANQCQTLDHSHSGKATSSIDARLLSIQVTTG